MPLRAWVDRRSEALYRGRGKNSGGGGLQRNATPAHRGLARPTHMDASEGASNRIELRKKMTTKKLKKCQEKPCISVLEKSNANSYDLSLVRSHKNQDCLSFLKKYQYDFTEGKNIQMSCENISKWSLQY